MVKLKEIRKQIQKRRPKTMADIQEHWDIKMLDAVMDFVYTTTQLINPKLLKYHKDGDYIIDGPEMEERLWKFCRKFRRIIQNETR